MKNRVAIPILLAAAACGCVAPSPSVEPVAEPLSDSHAEAAVGPATELPATEPPAAAAAPAGLEAALTASLAYLERDGAAWMHGESELNRDNGCISCHVVSFALWSHSAAEHNGLEVNGPAIAELTETAVEFIGRPRIGRAVTWGQMMLGRSVATEQDHDWLPMVAGTLESQERAGHWRARGQFPQQRRPVAESDAVATMWSLLALDSIGAAVADAPGSEARRRALEWLEGSTEGVSSEWLAMRLLTEQRLGDEAAAAELLARLVDEQRPDGGWSWLLAESPGGDEDPSNAYSTGVALYALRQADLPRTDPALRAAAGYLIASQRGDGTWDVPSHLISAEPSVPKDYVYEYWGTAWSVIGLSEMLEPRVEPAA